MSGRTYECDEAFKRIQSLSVKPHSNMHIKSLPSDYKERCVDTKPFPQGCPDLCQANDCNQLTHSVKLIPKKILQTP